MSDLNKYSPGIVRNLIKNEQMQLHPPARTLWKPGTAVYKHHYWAGGCNEGGKSRSNMILSANTFNAILWFLTP